MSISSTTCRNLYVGNGSVSVYDYDFKLFESSDLEVWVMDTSGNVTQLTETTDYTVAGVGLRNGGAVTLVSSGQPWLTGGGKLITGYQILLIRWLELTQDTDIKNQGAYYPELHENEFDTLVMQIQMLQDQIFRSAMFPLFITPDIFDPTLPPGLAEAPGAALIVNSLGNGFAVGPVQSSVSATAIYDAVVGVESGCNYATLAAALAAAASNWRILVKDSFTMDTGSEFALTIANILIEFAPGVTYSKGTLTGPAFSIQASGVRIKGGRFEGFDTAIEIQNGNNNNFITECRFASVGADIDDLNTAPNNINLMNIDE